MLIWIPTSCSRFCFVGGGLLFGRGVLLFDSNRLCIKVTGMFPLNNLSAKSEAGFDHKEVHKLRMKTKESHSKDDLQLEDIYRLK